MKPLIYSCSGFSGAAQMANYIAIQIDRKGIAGTYCIAGVGGNVLGLENVMFEAADPQAFKGYIKNYGPEVNLFVDHSRIVQLECTREGIWGTNDIWGRILTYK